MVKVSRRVDPAPPPGAVRGPSDRALDRLVGRFAIGLRLGSAVACAVAGPLAEDGLVHPSEVAVYTSWAFRETT